jgi:hypothetical protein
VFATVRPQYPAYFSTFATRFLHSARGDLSPIDITSYRIPGVPPLCGALAMLFGRCVAALFLGSSCVGVDASGLVRRNRAFNVDAVAAESKSFNLTSQHAFGQSLAVEAATPGDSGPGALLCPDGVCVDVSLYFTLCQYIYFGYSPPSDNQR